MFDLIGYYYCNCRKIGQAVTCYVVILALVFVPVMGLSNDPSYESPPETIQVAEVSDSTPIDQVFNDDNTEKKVNKSLAFLVSTEIFESIRYNLDIRFWSPIVMPLANGASRIIGYGAVNIPEVARSFINAFRHPLDSSKNVTIVTTAIGVTSTITSFTAGAYAAGESGEVLVARAVLLLGLTALYRSKYDVIGTLLTYKGWRRKDIIKNMELENVYLGYIKQRKNEMPAGLIEDNLPSRLAKIFLIELMFLAPLKALDLIFPQAEKGSEMMSDLINTDGAYTASSAYELIVTRKMIAKKITVPGATPEEIEREQNKVAFKYKSTSIGLSFLQNLLVVPALAGSGEFQTILWAVGAAVVGYEIVDRHWQAFTAARAQAPALTCSGSFTL